MLRGLLSSRRAREGQTPFDTVVKLYGPLTRCGHVRRIPTPTGLWFPWESLSWWR